LGLVSRQLRIPDESDHLTHLHGPSAAAPSSPVTTSPQHPNTLDIGELLLGLGVVVLGGLMVWQTTLIRLTPAYAKVGPRVIPFIVSGGLIVFGLFLAGAALTGRSTAGSADSEDVDLSLPTDWRTVGLLTLALVAYLILIEPVGFIIASAVLFAGAAFAMGSRRVARDIAVGVILATILYIGFTRGLGLRLPAGVLTGIV